MHMGLSCMENRAEQARGSETEQHSPWPLLQFLPLMADHLQPVSKTNPFFSQVCLCPLLSQQQRVKKVGIGVGARAVLGWPCWKDFGAVGKAVGCSQLSELSEASQQAALPGSPPQFLSPGSCLELLASYGDKLWNYKVKYKCFLSFSS